MPLESGVGKTQESSFEGSSFMLFSLKKKKEFETRFRVDRAMNEEESEMQQELPLILMKQIAATVRNSQWSYAIVWSISTSVLEWSDGYYNGQIKTRKTTQPMELKADENEINSERSEQLRDLYESLSSGHECNHQIKRPSASLSPEDLTDTEWFYLVCMSYTFLVGQGLPGNALIKNEYIWLNNAPFADTKLFSRSLLAKTAAIQTVVCIPIMGIGVVELGTTEQITEDPSLVKRVTSFFWGVPKPVCSEQSISNTPQMAEDEEDILCSGNDMDSSIVLEEQSFTVDCQTALMENRPTNLPFNLQSFIAADQTESLNDKVEELLAGNYDGSSGECCDCCPTQHLENLFGVDGILNCVSLTRNNLDYDFNNGQLGSLNSNDYASSTFVNAQRIVPCAEKTTIRYQMLDFDGEASHYERMVTAIMESSKLGKPVLCSQNPANKSSFVGWKRASNTAKPFAGTPQKLLKKILMDGEWLHGGRPRKQQNLLQEKPEGESGTNHVLSERRRREKLNAKFLVLRSLIPSIGKVDKASVLSDTIEYLKDLERRVQELESLRQLVEVDTRDTRKHCDVAERTSDNYGNKEMRKCRKPSTNKRKASEKDWGLCRDGLVAVNVSMKKKRGLVEIHCPWRACLLLEIVKSMSNHHLDPLSVQSSTTDGVLALTIKSKWRSGSAASPGMIKRSLERVIGIVPSRGKRCKRLQLVPL